MKNLTAGLEPAVFLRDVVRRDPLTEKPLIEDATDIPGGKALVNGKRAVYILVTKRADASTLRASLGKGRSRGAARRPTAALTVLGGLGIRSACWSHPAR